MVELINLSLLILLKITCIECILITNDFSFETRESTITPFTQRTKRNVLLEFVTLAHLDQNHFSIGLQALILMHPYPLL